MAERTPSCQFDNAPSATLCVSNLLLNQGFLFIVYSTLLSIAQSARRHMLQSLVNSELEQYMYVACVLLSYMSRVRFPVLQCGFFLEREDPHGDHGLGSLVELKFKAPPGTSYSYITIHLIRTT
jgi:hypothetical protein